MKEETKAKAAKLWEDVKSGLKTGLAATKKGLSKTGTAIQSYSDLAMVQIEIKQFESKRKKAFEALGKLAFEEFSEKGAVSFSAGEEVKAFVEEISACNKEIAKREKVIKAAEKEGKIPTVGKDKKAAAKKPAAKKAPAKKTAKKAE